MSRWVWVPLGIGYLVFVAGALASTPNLALAGALIMAAGAAVMFVSQWRALRRKHARQDERFRHEVARVWHDHPTTKGTP